MSPRSNPTNGPGQTGRRPFAPLSAGELNDLWDVDLLTDEQATLDAAFAADPAIRSELAPILCALDYERRHLFVSALAAILDRVEGTIDLSAALEEALDGTRHAAFVIAMLDQRQT